MITSALPRRVALVMLAAIAACLLLAPTGEARIVEGKSIARVKLGMKKKQVKRVLGKPDSVSRLRGGAWQYEHPRLQVSFRKGKVNVLLLWDRKQKTRKQIRIGSSVEDVQAAYPKADCVLDPNEAPYIPICFVSSRFRGKQSETYFRLDQPDGKVTEIQVYFGTMRAAASKAHAVAKCNIRGQERKLGTTYVTSLETRRVGCGRAKNLVKAFHRCRHRHGGADGHCARVKGYRCKERREAIPTQYDSRATCKRGGHRVVQVYTQNT
jgi:hypothetical protein